MKRLILVAVVLAGIGAAFFIFSSRSPGLTTHDSDSDPAGRVINTSIDHQPEGNNNQDHSSARNAQEVRLVDVIAEKISQKGMSSPEVADLVLFSQGVCTDHFDKIKKGVRAVGWANDYLSKACDGFDAARYQGVVDPAPDFFSIAIENGQAASTDAAMDYLKRPDSVHGAMNAGMVLIEGGKLPDQESYGLNTEQLGRALAAANAGTMCSGRNGCAVARLLAAASCSDKACPAGTTYDAALRRNLSPAELEASDRLSEWLRSIRK